jgi:hypothetical protein
MYQGFRQEKEPRPRIYYMYVYVHVHTYIHTRESDRTEDADYDIGKPIFAPSVAHAKERYVTAGNQPPPFRYLA